MKHQDKIAHLLAGYAIFDIIVTFSSLSAACFFVFFIAVVKEIVDGIRGGNPDAWDLVATFVGGGLGLLIYYLA
jgi:hypothetical protein